VNTRIGEILAVVTAKAKAGDLSVGRQLFEMAYLFVRHRIGPGYYLMARFWRRELPFAEKSGHWNGRRYLRFVHGVNDASYFKVSQNKLVEKCLLQGLKIPTIPMLGLFHPQKGQTTSGHELTTLDALRSALAQSGAGTFFFKPVEGDSGRGVFALRMDTANGVLCLCDAITGHRLDDEDLRGRLATSPAGYLVEPKVVQHQVLARLNPSSVNTLRIWVVNDRSGIHVVGAFLRIGRAGSVVDNTAAGGLACAVDVHTGVVKWALDLTPSRNQHVTHPDSGATLPGLQIPYWKECVAIACNALRVLPGARFSGMDVAVSSDGPLVVEYNVEPNQRGAAHFDVPHVQLFSGFDIR